MTRINRRVLAASAAVLLAAVLAWAFVEGRGELARERERERPIKVAPRVSGSASAGIVVEIDTATRERIGLETQPLAARSEPAVVAAFGSAIDPEPLLSLHAELSTAEAALAASRAELARTRTLHAEGENASAKALDAAAAQMAADESRARLAERRIALSFGDDVARLTSAEREALARRLAARELVFVRASLPLGEELAGDPRGASVLVVGDEDRPLVAIRVDDAPSLDPQALGRTFLVRVEPGRTALRPGAAVKVLLEAPGEPRHGVVVPRASVVRADGAAWAYLQVDEQHFARRPLALDHPTSDGWLVSGGPAAGDRVVIAGAQTLLSEEQKSQIQVGEENE